MTVTDFENHTIFEKLFHLNTKLNDKEFRKLIGIDSLNFFETSENYLKDRLKLTIPIIVQEAELTTISQEIDNALAQINAFIGNSNLGHITNATNHLYTAISRVRNLPLPFSKNDFNFSRSISNFEKLVKEKHETLVTDNKELINKVEQLNNEIAANKEELQRISKLLLLKETEIQNLTSTYQTDYNNFKSSASQNHEQDRIAYKTEFNQFKQEFVNEKESIKASIATDTESLIAELNVKLTEAKKIVGVIGDVSVTGNYQQVANSHKSDANTLRAIAIVLMTILSGLLIYAIWDISTGTFDWVKSVVRIMAAAALSYPATYAARESSKHRILENVNRKAELELASINPFIELLPEIKKQEIKEKLVEKYFGNNLYADSESISQKEDDVSVNALERILKTILPHIKQ